MMFNKRNDALLVIVIASLILFLSNIISITGGFFAGKTDATNSYIKTSTTSKNRKIILVEESDYLINQQLARTISEIQDAILIRIGLIQSNSPVVGSGQIPLLRFDVTHSIAPPGMPVGTLVSNMPLSQWNDYLPILIDGKCAVVSINQITNVDAKERMRNDLKINTFIGCPLRDRQGELIGGVFVSWSERPSDAIIQKTIPLLQATATKIVSYLEIRIDERAN